MEMVSKGEKGEYSLKCHFSGINSIDILEIWYRTGTRLMHGTCGTCIFYCPIEKLIKLFSVKFFS